MGSSGALPQGSAPIDAEGDAEGEAEGEADATDLGSAAAMAPKWVGDGAGRDTGVLSWIERGDEQEFLLRFASTGPAGFGRPQTALRFSDGFVNWADVPTLPVGCRWSDLVGAALAGSPAWCPSAEMCLWSGPGPGRGSGCWIWE